MKRWVNHPRTIVALLLLTVAVGSLAVLLADGSESVPVVNVPPSTATSTQAPLADRSEEVPATLVPIVTPTQVRLPITEPRERIETASVPVGDPPTLERKPPLTMQEKEDASRIVQVSGIVERINGGQGWMATRVYRTIIAGRDGIQFDAIWDEPVDSAGPWTLLQCTGTLRVESSARWRDVTRLVIWVDTQEDSVAGYAVISEPEDVLQPAIDNAQSLTDIIRAYSTLTGRLLYVGPSALSPPRAILCESGTYYRD